MTTKTPTKPIIDPDVTEIPNAVGLTEHALDPFIPARVRAGIYAVSGLVAVAASASAPAVGGVVGDVLAIIAASAAAIGGTTALSHISK